MIKKRKTILPLEILPIRDGGYHCFALVKINGKELRMVVDTGASRTVLDYKTAEFLSLAESLEMNEEKAAGIGTSEMDTYILSLDELHIGDILIHDYVVGILDLKHVNQSYEMLEMPNVHGILGCDLMIDHDAKIDFGEKSLVLYSAEDANA